MKILSILVALFLLTASAHAASPLLVYSYGNQITSSTLAISSDGTVVHTERVHAHLEVVNENPLSGAELANLKSLVAKAAQAKVTKKSISASLGSRSGTISTYVNGVKKDLEGVVRVPTDLSKATRLTNSSSSIKAIKTLINRIVKVDLP